MNSDMTDESGEGYHLNDEEAALAAAALKEVATSGPWPVNVRRQMVALSKDIRGDSDGE